MKENTFIQACKVVLGALLYGVAIYALATLLW